MPLTLASLRGETEPEPPDGREAGPRWALWNYETKEWDVLPDGYDPTTDETDENEEEEPA